MFAATCALLVAVATVCSAQLITLTREEKQAILNAHNTLRARTALGNTGGQPSATNMLSLEWDDRLMRTAGSWVSQCVVGHDKVRTLPGYSWVGQNWAGGFSKNYSSYVESWFNEYTEYTFDTQECGDVCGHYTQVVWAKTTLVGCAPAKCSKYPIHFVCNYATGGNFNGELPYVKGPSSSQCSGDWSLSQRGLCVRKDQCIGNGDPCVCSLTACANGGTLDAVNCRCNCPANYYGNTCEKLCEDEASAKRMCDYHKQNVCQYTGYDVRCAKTCGMCKRTLVRDLLVENADGISSGSPLPL